MFGASTTFSSSDLSRMQGDRVKEAYKIGEFTLGTDLLKMGFFRAAKASLSVGCDRMKVGVKYSLKQGAKSRKNLLYKPTVSAVTLQCLADARNKFGGVE